MRVCVLDIEPIEPAQGGSRLRLKGLYHALGPGFDTVYIGAFHWPGPAFRRLRHGPGFEEITVPFSERHFEAASALSAAAAGATIIDASFPRLGALSPEFCSRAQQEAARADIVIFSHPWVFALAREAVSRSRRLLVYDAHNVEGELRRELLGGTKAGREIAAEVEALERDLCRAADLVIACSQSDRVSFVDRYGIDPAKTRVCPNGAFASDIAPAPTGVRRAARAALGIGRDPLAVFIGGWYPPNVDAARFICDDLAPACPGLTFAVLGDSGNAIMQRGTPARIPANVRVAGRIEEKSRRLWLNAADLGINPVTTGSGTNVKMFDYMAAGLPIVTTPVGARGIADSGAWVLSGRDRFAPELRSLAADHSRAASMGRLGRRLLEREHDWANISAELGVVLCRAARNDRPQPLFSVTVPTLDRPGKLRRLLDLLAVQSERDFEVIVVDQSGEPFAPEDFGIEVLVLHSAVRGQCHARNLAAAVARGRILAFIDDDCEPADSWLAEARREFEQRSIVGLEGRVVSDRMKDARWRSVHNYGAEGLGFMTCNLFVTAKAFRRLGGFDPAFDEHQHRYDTDLGWRLQENGDIPFSEEAFVYHPPWARSLARESEAQRNLLFEADALLLRKHPQRYRELFLREAHWCKGPAFWEPFLRGVERLGIALPDYITRRLPRALRRAAAPS